MTVCWATSEAKAKRTAHKIWPNAALSGELSQELPTPAHFEQATDRPPIVGVVGRSSGHIRLQVGDHSDRATLQPFVECHTRDDTTVNTAEWSAYRRRAATGRCHQTVCPTPGQRQWARDVDAGFLTRHDDPLYL
jgi:hypothetical protein